MKILTEFLLIALLSVYVPCLLNMTYYNLQRVHEFALKRVLTMSPLNQYASSFCRLQMEWFIHVFFLGKLLAVQAAQQQTIKLWQGRADSWHDAYVLRHDSNVTSFAWCDNPGTNQSPYVMIAT